jgi:hypothetical protein
MAKFVLGPKVLLERNVSIPGAKPPVFSFPFRDLGHPDEVDSFRRFVRQLRRQTRARAKPPK